MVVVGDLQELRKRPAWSAVGPTETGCRLWREPGLDGFWQEKRSGVRGPEPWESVPGILAVNRLLRGHWPGQHDATHLWDTCIQLTEAAFQILKTGS